MIKLRVVSTLATAAVQLVATCLLHAGTPSGRYGTLLEYNFEDESSWPVKPGETTGAVLAEVEHKQMGTIDIAGGKTPSGAMILSVKGGQKVWSAELSSGPLAIRNQETNLGKLTFSFAVAVSQVHPVLVRVESFNDQHRRSGGLESVIYPAASDFYQRYAVDLSSMKAVGAGTFNPADAFVSLSFVVGSNTAWNTAELCELCVDNVNFARPAWYVSPRGRNSNDGRSEATPFGTPQRAVDAAEPGDIILMMDGTYPIDRSQTIFHHGGRPSGWISLKNYPGQHPVLLNEAWNCVSVGAGGNDKSSTVPAIGYIEVRGLHIVGDAGYANKKYADVLDQADPRTNGNGISVDGRKQANVPHHFRFADNLVESNCGAGINTIDADWVTIENNISRNNCWWMIYAGSGISVMGTSNFDATEGNYKQLVRNNDVSGNRCFLKWKAMKKYSDGNGIILDVNNMSQGHPGRHFIGRTLVQGNISFNNGGGGIHDVRADHVDIINNTTYLNSASPELQYPEIDAGNADDVRVFNNILVAPVANLSAGEKKEPVNENHRSTHLIFSHNLYAGGNIPPVVGDGDRIADPLFVLPSIEFEKANFRLQSNSPALRAGAHQPFSPLVDFYGRAFPLDLAPDLGAIQQ